MKTMLKHGLSLLIAAIVYAGCSVDYPSSSEKPLPLITTSGTANFTKFVVAGNSLTAGYQNGGLSEQFQVNSYGAQISRQLGLEHGGELGSDFEQPLVDDPGTSGILTLNLTTTKPTAVTNPSNSFINAALARAYDNLGIPGAFIYDFKNGTSSATSWVAGVLGSSPNTLFDAILRGSGSQFTQLQTLNPTFIIWWEGHNDILGYATNGAGLNGSFTAISGVPPYTPRSQAEATGFGFPSTLNFPDMYTDALTSVAGITGSEVITGNIPYVTSIPYFTFLYPNPTVLPVVDTLILSAVTGAKGRLYYQETKDSIQYVLLPASSVFGSTSASIGDLNASTPYGLHPLDPVSGKYTLTFAEVRSIKSIIDTYNSAIAAAATANGVTVVDFNTIFNNIATTGISYPGGFVANAKFLSGGLFSLDGVHPSSHGYAVVANAFIDAINTQYGSDIPRINEAKFLNTK
ncbi:hypothetical protein F9K33_08620 [bacterium]|nr:MAG: hypothetical protein F9K33_08620 [bacterium]